MKPRASVVVNGLFFVALAWLYIGDLYEAVRGASAEVAALSGLPSVPFAVAVLVAATVAAGLTVFGVATQRGREWRGYRVMPLVVLVALFVDLLVLTENRATFTSSMRAVAAVDMFQQRVEERSTASTVPVDVKVLDEAAAELGEPPWLVKGQQLKAWRVEVVQGCKGPKVDSGTAGAGTLFYCVSEARDEAWVTVVGRTSDDRFGPPAVVTLNGQVLLGHVQRRVEEAQKSEDESPGMPLMFDADAGTLAAP